MESKLGLNFELVNRARASAAKIADDTQHFIDQHTTVTVERAVCRLLGIDGVNDMDVPLPNVVVDHLMANSLLPVGAAWAIGNAMVETGKDPQGVADAVNSGELDLSKVPAHSDAEIRGAITPVVNATVERINKNVAKRNSYLKAWGDKEGPYLYIIVATGNIYEDITQAKGRCQAGRGHHRRHPYHRSVPAGLRALRRDHRGFGGTLRYPGELPPDARGAG